MESKPERVHRRDTADLHRPQRRHHPQGMDTLESDLVRHVSAGDHRRDKKNKLQNRDLVLIFNLL